MFFDLVRRNSRRSRKENGIFFASLIVAIAAFYIILSLENQDVMIFLKTMESDAVNKLLQLIPVMYAVTLFILFFLVYFANNYQLDRRSHEFGIYLMMGIKRTRLFAMLLAEDIWSSVFSLAAGLPIAVLLSEITSLITAKLVGLGIIGHHFTFSVHAVLWTIIGFFAIKFLALLLLSGRIAGMEIGQLLEDAQEEKDQTVQRNNAKIKLPAGFLFLAAAYALAIMGKSWTSVLSMGLTVILGISGTFLLFDGFGAWLERLLKRKGNKKRLGVFTFRQLQENVCLQSKSLAVSSLLMLMALCCFGYGVSVGLNSQEKQGHAIDYTFKDETALVKSQLNTPEMKPYIDTLFELRTGMFQAGPDPDTGVETHTFDWGTLPENIMKQEKSENQDALINNIQQVSEPYLISLSGYNQILKLAGEPPIQLNENEAALYCDADFANDIQYDLLGAALAGGSYVEMDGQQCRLIGQICRQNLVVDRAITISYGLVVSDEVFDRLIETLRYNTFWNAALKKEAVEEKGLMLTIAQVNRILDQKGLNYESYLQNIGRQLFYLVGSSYTTIYLAVIFLIIANTVISVQFLMHQKKSGKRCRTLAGLGCSYDMLCQSARTQIKWYFGLPVAAAAISSLFGVKSLFAGFLPSSMRSQLFMLSVIALAMIVLLCVVEYIYIFTVMKLSDKHLLQLMQAERSE